MEYQYDYFVSYAHDDDKSQKDAEIGFVSEFVRKIVENEEFRKLFGAPPRVFFDKSSLRGMDDWNAKIREGIAGSRFFIAMISPNYFESDSCRYEFDWWVSREAQRQLVGEAAAPIQIVKIPGLFSNSDNDLPPEFQGKYWRQICNFRRYQSPKSFDLSDLNYAKIDDALKELKTQSDERVYRQNAAARSLLSLYYPKHNVNFVGRRGNLDKLRKDLTTSSVAAISAVNGLGGIGKTELALTYGHAFAWDYELGRAFVRCENKTSLRSAILSSNLASLVGLSRLEGRNEEEQYAQLWLLLSAKRQEIVERNIAENRNPNLGARLYLILDNATDPKLVSQEELAQLPEFVHAVVTTRESREVFSHVEGQTLDALSEEEALELLDNLRRFKDESDKEAAREIARRLGGFALAVEIVGSYLRQKTFETYGEYAERLRADLTKVLDETTLTHDLQLKNHYVDFVASVLAPTFAALSKNAKRLLDAASLFAPDSIPLPWLGELAQLDDHATKEGLFELENYGILTPIDEAKKGEIWNANLARLHRLAREQIRAALPKEFGNSVRAAIRGKSTKTLEGDSDAFFKPGGDWILNAIFEFHLESIAERKESSQSNVNLYLTWTLLALGRIFQRLGSTTQARTAFREGRSTCERLVETLPDDPSVQRTISIFYDELGDLELREGAVVQARKCYQKSLKIWQKLAQVLPNDVEIQRDLSLSFGRLGNLELSEGNAVQAREYYQEDLKIARGLAESFPNDVESQRDLSVSLNNLGYLELSEGNAVQAREYYQESLKIRRGLAESLPNDVESQRDLSVSFCKLGELEREPGRASTQRIFGDLDVARRYFADALARIQRLVDALSIVPPLLRLDLGGYELNLGDCARASGNLNEARSCYERALATFESIEETAYDVAYHRETTALIYRNLGDLDAEEGYFESARARWGKFVATAERAATETANNWVLQSLVYAAIYRRSLIALKDDDLEKARELLQEAVARCERLVERYPSLRLFAVDLEFLREEFEAVNSRR